jgi:RNA polymerase sigma-70 factor (ECF subfamily)
MSNESSERGVSLRVAAWSGSAAEDNDAFVRAVVAGQPWAERELFERYAPMVSGVLRRCLGAGHDIDDLTQEVFLTVYARIHTLRDFNALRSFIYSVAIRVAHWEGRRRGVRRRAQTTAFDHEETHGRMGSDPEARDLLARVQRILDAMHPKHRLAFVLHRVEGQTIALIAQELDVSVATVNRWVSRAVEHIDKAIKRDERVATLLAKGSSRP